MNLEKIKQWWKESNHTHYHDRKEKVTPYKCLDCEKYYYSFQLGSGGFLFFGGIVLGMMIILQKFVPVTPDNAVPILNILTPFLGITLLLFGLDPLIDSIRNIKRTDKSRLDKGLRNQYYSQFMLIICAGIVEAVGVMTFYAWYTLTEASKEIHP